MDVDKATLEFYMKQGFYTQSMPNDLGVQLQTALDMLELLTCDGTIAGKGLAYVLEPRPWSQLTTVLKVGEGLRSKVLLCPRKAPPDILQQSDKVGEHRDGRAIAVPGEQSGGAHRVPQRQPRIEHRSPDRTEHDQHHDVGQNQASGECLLL